MNEDSHVPRGPDTGRERVLTQRRGNGDDGAVAEQYIYTCILVLYSLCNAQQLLYPLVWQNHIQNLYDENTYKNAPG